MNKNNVFTDQLQKSFKELLDKHLCEYIPMQDSDSEHTEHYSDKKIEWKISTPAYNYHDEFWNEYTSVTIQILENYEYINTNFRKKEFDENISRNIFSPLVDDIEKHSESAYFRDNGSHCEDVNRGDYTLSYYYHYDVEYIFKFPYNYDIDIYLRCIKYDDR